MLNKCDVLIVGAGTTGVYFGWLMAKRGHSVLIVDRDARDQVAHRLEIIHFDRQTMKKLKIPAPSEAPELLFPWKEIYVSRLPLFLQRMYGILESDGVRFEFSCDFKELIFENRRIIGAKVMKDGEEHEILARLVVDASGVACSIRSSLPEDYGMETWKYESHNRFFVILHYIKWLEPNEPHPEWGHVVPYYFLFFDPGYTKDEAIMGIAGPESHEKAAILAKEVLERENFPPFEVKKKEFGSFAYTKSPYSLVGDGFFCVGDSAAIIQPVTTRCIKETWRLCKNIEEVFDASLKQDEYLSRELLWEVNVKHFRDDGAELAFLYMISSILNYLSEKEMDFLLDKLRPIVDPAEMSEEDADFELSVGSILKVILKVLQGILTGKVSIRRIFQLIKTYRYANKIKKHYKQYPEHPEDFEDWVRRAEELWSNRKPATREFRSTSATYP